MKKIMFMLVAAVVAVGAHAASVDWTCTNVKDGTGNAISGVAYFVNAATLSQATLASYTKASDFTTALSGMYSWTPATAGKYTAAAAVDNATLGLTDGTASQAYLVIFDTATITDASKYYVTEVKSFNALAGTETASVKWGSQSTPSQASGAWKAVAAVPEPTSGLLMVVGLGALALRRRRA